MCAFAAKNGKCIFYNNRMEIPSIGKWFLINQNDSNRWNNLVFDQWCLWIENFARFDPKTTFFGEKMMFSWNLGMVEFFLEVETHPEVNLRLLRTFWSTVQRFSFISFRAMRKWRWRRQHLSLFISELKITLNFS